MRGLVRVELSCGEGPRREALVQSLDHRAGHCEEEHRSPDQRANSGYAGDHQAVPKHCICGRPVPRCRNGAREQGDDRKQDDFQSPSTRGRCEPAALGDIVLKRAAGNRSRPPRPRHGTRCRKPVLAPVLLAPLLLFKLVLVQPILKSSRNLPLGARLATWQLEHVACQPLQREVRNAPEAKGLGTSPQEVVYPIPVLQHAEVTEVVHGVFPAPVLERRRAKAAVEVPT
mmetsp:Transcript_39429/g.104046  ORF Transcript_39429/g.104046 Transcript_39429/m.104046 type:complete len:229 (+) Transcript_39429:4306-4992(+)